MSSKKTRPDLLTVTQAATLLGKGYTRQSILMAIARGRLPAHRFGNVYLIERRAFEEYRATRKVGRPRGTEKQRSRGGSPGKTKAT
jgi:excisionase family DNA binding protein